MQEQPNIANVVISPELSGDLEVTEVSMGPKESVDDQQIDLGNGDGQESQETNHVPVCHASLSFGMGKQLNI